MGTSNTVSRALRLIAESGLEEGGLEGLADRLGVGSRHLRRLFIRHLGAPPSAVAQTRRLHFAKKLIDETRLPMGEIALAAGFGCVRRFNAAIRKTYKRTPTHIRNLARLKAEPVENQYIFHLRFRPPYDWNGMLSFLAARATPGVEAVEAGAYMRSISVNGIPGYFAVSLDAEHNSLTVQIQFGDPKALFFIIERIRAMFDLNADWADIACILRSDAVLAPMVDSAPGLRVPGAWNGFELAVRAVLGQQIRVGHATALAGRLTDAFGEPFAGNGFMTRLFPTAAALAKSDLSDVGLTRARAGTIRALAQAVVDRRLNFEGVVDSEMFRRQFMEIPGIGNWTAEYVAMRALGEPDAFPAGDVALQSALELSGARAAEQRAEPWRPWRSYATMYLWMMGHRSKVSKKKPSAAPGVIAESTESAVPLGVGD
jgi:AraC family transcriptional regulator of adaptative response / DNA-3-methyladenine glycosylase II